MPPNDEFIKLYDGVNMHAFDAMPPVAFSGRSEEDDLPGSASKVLGECEWCGGDPEVQNTASLIHRLLDDLNRDQRTAVLQMLKMDIGDVHDVHGAREHGEHDIVEIVNGEDALTGAGEEVEIVLGCEDDDVVGGEDEIVLGCEDSDDGTDVNDEDNYSGGRESAAHKINKAKSDHIEDTRRITAKPEPVDLNDFADVTPFIAHESLAMLDDDYVSSNHATPESEGEMYSDNYHAMDVNIAVPVMADQHVKNLLAQFEDMFA